LILPWGVLVLLGLLAPLWLPLLAPLPEPASLPGWTRDLPAALLPVAVGAALALATLQRGWRVPEPLRIPPGDLLLPLSRAAGLLRPASLRDLLWRGPQPVSGETPGATSGDAYRAAPGGAPQEIPGADRLPVRWLERANRGDLRMIRGPSLGVLLLGMAALLASLILVGGS
jgi:hypothetical protein